MGSKSGPRGSEAPETFSDPPTRLASHTRTLEVPITSSKFIQTRPPGCMMAGMTYEQFVAAVSAKHARMAGEHRYGSVYFDTLNTISPEIAQKLRNSLHDPFGRAKVSSQTHAYVRELWDAE